MQATGINSTDIVNEEQWLHAILNCVRWLQWYLDRRQSTSPSQPASPQTASQNKPTPTRLTDFKSYDLKCS